MVLNLKNEPIRYPRVGALLLKKQRAGSKEETGDRRTEDGNRMGRLVFN